MLKGRQTCPPPAPAPPAASIKKRAYAASAYARPGGRRRGRGWASSNSGGAAVPQVTARLAYHHMRRVRAEEVKLKVKDALDKVSGSFLPVAHG